jgi:hypothetical protein
MDDHIATARLNRRWAPFSGERPRTFSFEEAFQAAAQGRSRDQVRETLGEPDSRRVLQGFEVWQYDTLVVEGGQPRKLAVRFDGDLVAETQGM